MKITNKNRVEPYRNTFNQTSYEDIEIKHYEVTKEEFLNLLNKDFMLVNIKRTEESEFLFDNQPEYLVSDAKYAILNMKHGLESIRFADRLDRNDRTHDTLEII